MVIKILLLFLIFHLFFFLTRTALAYFTTKFFHSFSSLWIQDQEAEAKNQFEEQFVPKQEMSVPLSTKYWGRLGMFVALRLQ